MQLTEMMEAEILTISANDYAIEALRLMNQRNAPWAIVLDRDWIAGIVYAQELNRFPASLLKERDVQEYLRTNLLMIPEEAQPQEAERLLRNSGMDFLIVIRDNRPMGMITRDSLSRLAVKHKQAS